MPGVQIASCSIHLKNQISNKSIQVTNPRLVQSGQKDENNKYKLLQKVPGPINS
jgi:hypothetical protein